ncbi:DNA/RNA non-specific endonuclease [uncultured Coprobacter sp.]|uniref:DNA/RNA non-specific endonuclease n=1 Tax=Coprobacter sp. TaxID=1941478 RepID=UPI00261B0A8E|nr:DNA/RNA non-specific endonuclease [uncultured Coprobacter sp.]
MARKKRKKKKNINWSGRFLWIFFWITILLLFAYYFRLEIKSALSAFSTKIERLGEASRRPGIRYKSLELPLPLEDRAEQIIEHEGYTVSYNKNWRLPNWVAYELTRDELRGTATRTDKFVVDPYVNGVSATNTDYRKSGFDRGHMAPAADMTWSEMAMKESFYFSNMCPQHPGLNRGAWKDLEEHIRKWARRDSAIAIVCGPLVDERNTTIGRNEVKVPHAFFKVIVSPYVSTPRGIGFVFKNEKEDAPLSVYAVSIDSVEVLTGMDFFSELPDELENRLESQNNISDWEL